MAAPKPDPDNDREHDERRDHDNDNNSGRAVAPAPSGGALASLAALGKMLNAVDTSSVGGRSGLPMLQFKRDNNGTWSYGQRRTVVEDGSRWALNPLSFKYGYICFGEGKKVRDERLVPVNQPKPNVAELPDHGFPWVEQWTVNLKCLDGTDAGVEVAYKPTTRGGFDAVMGLINTVRDRFNGNQHDGKVSPVMLLHKDSYPHVEHGKVWIPVLDIVDWMAMDGPAPAPAPEPPPPQPEQQPRRRRVG